MKKLIFLFILSFITYPLLFGVAHAQSQPSLNLTVFPATIDLTANPGSTIQQKIRVRNNTSNPVDLTLQTAKLSTDDKGNILPVDTKDSFLSWISYSPSSFSALPQEWQDVTIQIKIPDSAAFGYYFAVKITPTNTNETAGKNSSTLIGQALVPILLDVKKAGAKADVQLVSFAPTSYLFEDLPVNFTITLINHGNVHIRPVGNIFIQSGNSDIGVLDVNTAGGALLPSEKRTFNTYWDDGFLTQEPIVIDNQIQKDSQGNPKTQLIIHWDKLTSLRIGKYSAHLLAVYDNGTRDVPIEANATFWVIPWKFILSVIAAVIVCIILVRIWLKWYVAKEIKKHRTS